MGEAKSIHDVEDIRTAPSAEDLELFFTDVSNIAGTFWNVLDADWNVV